MAPRSITRKFSPKRVLLILLIAVLSLLMLEGLLRAYVASASRPNPTMLSPYQMVDPQNGKSWVLKPGYTATVSDLIEAKEIRGMMLGAALIKEGAREYEYGAGDVLFQVNKFGFKGPEIEKNRDPATTRIIAIGDSTTFGTHFDQFSYPRRLERYLQVRGIPAEVINAGVEGYSIRHVQYHLQYFISFRPDLAIIYVGWNSLYPDTFDKREMYVARALRKAYTYYRQRASDWKIEGARLRYRDHYYSSSTEEALRYTSSYEPSFFPEFRKIVDELSQAGVTPVLTTLPGLFSIYSQPAEAALRMGHLPGDVKNAYVLAAMTHKYNEAIRLLARQENLPLIDLEEWRNKTLMPPEEWFSDSVHLSPKGQTAIGDYIGERLIQLGLISRAK